MIKADFAVQHTAKQVSSKTRSVRSNTIAAKGERVGKSAPEGVVFSFRLLIFDKVIINSLISIV